MISIEELREIEPELKDLPEKEVERIRDLLYQQAQLALECFFKAKRPQEQVAPCPPPLAPSSLKKIEDVI